MLLSGALKNIRMIQGTQCEKAAREETCYADMRGRSSYPFQALRKDVIQKELQVFIRSAGTGRVLW